MKTIITILIFFISNLLCAQPVSKKLVVDLNGSGDFTSIQAAINSLPDSSAKARMIYIKKGLYREKIFITKHNLVLLGEDRATTIIQQEIARDEWRCDHEDDWGVATVNVNGNDVTLQDLTIANDYGFNNKEPRTVPCKADSTGKRLITHTGHQMALRTMQATRLRAVNCHFRAYAGDTVSPWNLQDGMFYFKDCIMEGGVDLYCPRGMAYAENCRIFAHTGSAAVWHDGTGNPEYKTVFKNCRFDGFDGFRLGRFHRDAQFYFINSTFSANMANQDVYLVPTSNTILWGKRVYYHNAKRTGGDFAWHSDNLHTASGAPPASDINADWVFNGRWKPQATHTWDFIPGAYAGLKKLMNDSLYGSNLSRETMPQQHKPNDFAVQSLPYYKAEGPVWENDKVGFRLYFDQRNAKDIFGKTRANMVLDTVGNAGDKFYHHFDPQWGMDILKVGTSLGAGALAMKLKQANGKDTVIRLGGNVSATEYELVKNNGEQAVIRLHYKGWKVLDRIYDLTEEISISSGNYFYQSSVTVKKLRGDEKIVTGIVNLKSTTSATFTEGEHAVMYTHDRQTENNDFLGMAIMTPKYFKPGFSEAPKSGNGITSTYYLALDPRSEQTIVFRFYACWEQTNDQFSDLKYFENFLKQEAAAWKAGSRFAAKEKTVKN